MSKRPIIYRYFEFDEFLRDWFDFLKSGQSLFSLRELAKKAKISTGYLPMVLSGKRKLTNNMLNKIIPHLELTTEEEIHFELLVQLKNAENQEAKMRYLSLMEQNSNYKKYNKHESETYRYLTHWYYVAIREMTALQDFQDDPQWISKKLKDKVSKEEIVKALKFLIDKRFIIKGKDGKYLPPDKNIECYGGVFKLALTEFHKEMFEMGVKSISNTHRDNRNIKGHTFAIPKDKIANAKKIIDDAEEALIELGNQEESGSVVMQGQLAIFPLTKIEEETSDE